jgi:hypothetical protein
MLGGDRTRPYPSSRVSNKSSGASYGSANSSEGSKLEGIRTGKANNRKSNPVIDQLSDPMGDIRATESKITDVGEGPVKIATALAERGYSEPTAHSLTAYERHTSSFRICSTKADGLVSKKSICNIGD